MSHPRIEEVSDSDLSDPSEGDIDDFAESDILRQINPSSKPAQGTPSTFQQQPNLFNPLNAPQVTTGNIQPADVAGYQVIYPIYFDIARTRAEGRRVSSSLAVKNPLAREIATACATIRISPVFEAMKKHPQDWANPGRVRVNLKDPNNPYAKQIKNKHHLYILIAKHLQQNPTTDQSEALRRVKITGLPGQPGDKDEWPRPAVPRGWKVNELIPAYSSAITGGGVSENAFRDMMKEMGGGAGGPGGGMGGMGDMMSMLQGAAGPSGGAGAGAGGEQSGGGKKNKKAKGKAG